ncbi:RNA polymerase-associated protein rtf1 [Coemansia sp. RSA 1721]|nr:RNA polymerase-associated protein rtf1 [Coemansia sp. RSA 1721]
MDNLENDILELFEDDANTARGQDRNRSDHKRRRPQPRRDNYNASSNESDVDMDTADDEPEITRTNEPIDEWGDDLMGDYKDRKYLASLTEIDRERILAERQERRDILNEQRELRVKLNTGAKVSVDNNKPQRNKRSVREGTVFSDLKKAREKRRRNSPNRWSSASSDDDDEEQAKVATLDEINSICMSRNQLEQWLFKPFLSDTIVGCFVRIVTRTRDSTGEYNQYKMMQIIGVVQGEGRDQPLYHLNKSLTDKYLTLRFGGIDKDYSMETISNSPIKPEEMAAWDTAVRVARLRTRITPDMVERKLQDLEKARDYKLSEAEITFMVDERARLRRLESGETVSDAVVERLRLNQQRTDARQNEDWERLKNIETRLAELDKIIANSGRSDSVSHTTTTHKPLLAPSTSKYSMTAEGKTSVRRKKLLTPSSVRTLGANRNSVSQGSVASVAGSFRLVLPNKTPELVLKAKVSPGYLEVMKDSSGYDMSFISI